MDYKEALEIMNNKQSLGIKPGLARIKRLLKDMDNPQDELKIIHIAGTNGKGTVAKTIADTLILNNMKVGLFTSPWILDYREQIQINNEFISKSEFCDYVEKYSCFDCTEFETIVAIMYKYFADKDVDYAVVECGMGGKSDATNVEIDNICSVITSVSLDHTNFLGDTKEKIKKEKLGIVRSTPCFDYENYAEFDDFNRNNLCLVKAVVDYLGYKSDNVTLSQLTGRKQRFNGVLLDGGHNVEAALGLSKIINNEVALIGMMKDKDVEGYLKLIAPKCKKIIITQPDVSRAMDASQLAEIAKKYCNDVETIYSPANAICNNNFTLICGSFYLLREIIKLI